MKVLVIGMGSIAGKHIAALRELYSEVEVYALRSSNPASEFPNVRNIFSWDATPSDIDFILIANPTSEHLNTLKRAMKFRKPILLEKPPFMSLDGVDELLASIRQQPVTIYTGFNLRFYPLITWLKANVPVNLVREVQVYCGSYLPDWRKDQDYKKNYSAIRKLGGGVHLDLIHEMDYVTWIFGRPSAVKTFLSKVSELEIESIDSAHYWLTYPHMNISILLNYFRRDKKRNLEIVMSNDTWVADLLSGTVTNARGEVVFSTSTHVVDSYREQMRYFLDGVQHGKPIMNDLYESLETLKLSLA